MGTTDIKFDTTSMKANMPLLYEKLGPDLPILFSTSFRDAKIEFGTVEKDVTLEFMMKFIFRIDTHFDMKDLVTKKKLPPPELIYDELPVRTSG